MVLRLSVSGGSAGCFTSNAKDDGGPRQDYYISRETKWQQPGIHGSPQRLLRTCGMARCRALAYHTQAMVRRSAQRGRSSGLQRVPEGITLDKLERLRGQIMSEPEFREDWGPLYDQLLAQEHARAVTSVSDRLLGDRIRQVVTQDSGLPPGTWQRQPEVPRLSVTGSSSATPWSCIEKRRGPMALRQQG